MCTFWCVTKRMIEFVLILFLLCCTLNIRWPPPSDSNETQGQDSFIEFKMRQQQQRKITPHYQEYDQGEGEPVTEGGVEWEEFEIENIVSNEDLRSAHPSGVKHETKHENGYKEEGEKRKKKSK